jgi:putative heme-binding domain-containing protein
VLARIDAAEARRAVRARLRDAAADVAHSALAAVSLWRDREAVGELLQVLASGGPTARRLASEALGRIGDAQAVAPLVAAAASTEDRALEHAVIYALWEINDHAALRAALAGAAPQSERAAMVALDQVDGGGADPRRMAQWSVGPDPLHRATARWLIGRNPSWGAELADFYRGRIAAGELSDAELAEWSSQLARLAGNLDVQQVLAQVAAESNAPTARLLAALAAMERSGLADCPQAWAVPLAEHVRSPRGDVAAAALAAARLWAGSKQPAPQLALALRELAHDERQPVERRLQALAAVPGGPAALAENEFRLARDALDPRGPVGLRSLGVEVLLRAELSGAQRRALCQSLRSAGPLELPRLLAVFERGSEPQLGLELVAALNEATAVGSLRSETVRPLVARFGSQVEAAASELLARLDAQQAQQKSRLQELAGKLAGGDVRRGQTVFNSEKAACAACHAIGYLGGTVGPDLTRIGQIRSELDLLEAIAFPSASFVRSYEPVHVETVDGRIFQGVVRRDAADELVLATGPREEVRLARSDIESLRPGSVSVMPAGLDQQLTPEELADLVAFLKAAR